ncbi:MAG: zinc ribbon domain-containing protein [Promethearchaeia archaeon]
MGLFDKKEEKPKTKEELKEEKIHKIMNRLEREEKEQERIQVEAKLVSSPPEQPGVNVKIKVKILDDSFYAKGAKVFYNPGTEDFEEISMEQIDLDNFAVILSNIPKELKIIYYIKILDKSGEYQQFPRPELIDPDGTSEEEPYYSFSVEPDGTISFKKDWDDSDLVKCKVCGYMCQPSWEVCPECNTNLYDSSQEVFLEEEKRKEKEREKRKRDKGAWEDAADESWRTLPECPNCGYTVQLEWTKCPVCSFDLESVDLKKTPSYEEYMSEEDKKAWEEREGQMSEIKKQKEKAKEEKEDGEKEEIWEDDEGEGIDIL